MNTEPDDLIGILVFLNGRLRELARQPDQGGYHVADLHLKRQLLRQWIKHRTEGEWMRSSVNPECADVAVRMDALAELYEPFVRMLAACWQSHPDYQPGWAPQ